MKKELRYVQVYTKRNVRDPIDWESIEKIRNEGWELINIFGSLGEAVRNPSVAPIYAIFSKDEAGGGYAELEAECKVLTDKNKEMKKELQALKMQVGRLKKKPKQPSHPYGDK